MMNIFIKKACAILFLSTILVSLPGAFFVGYAAAGTDFPNQALIFLRDVVKVDLAKYKATLVVGPITDHPSWLGGLTQVHGKYNLTSETSWVEVLWEFVNGTLNYCTADVRIGKLLLSEASPASMSDAVNVLMQRYQTYTRDSSVEDMRSMVQAVDLSKSTTVSTSNLKLEVTVDSSKVAFFDWHNMLDGAAYSGLNVGFQDGVFSGLSDDRSYMKAAGAPVVVSEERAVNVALACAASFSYSYGGQDISGFDIMKSQIRSGLLTMGRDNVLVWYPYWKVILPFTHSYPGYITSIVVEIWADTAQVISVVPMGSDEGISETPPAPSTSSTASPLPSTTPTQATSTSAPPEPSDMSPTQSPTSTAAPTSTSQSTASASLQPAENGEDSKGGTDFGPLIMVAVVCVGVALAASLAFVVKRRHG
jgi:hypothetical protein